MAKTKRHTDRYLELHAQGLTNIEIARKCGVSPSAVTRYFQDNGITRNGIGRHSKHEKALRRAEKRNLTYRQAAKEMGLSPRYVSAICKRLGIKLVDGRGAGNNRGKGARELPKVKPLPWEEVNPGHFWRAEVFGAMYTVMSSRDGDGTYCAETYINGRAHDQHRETRLSLEDAFKWQERQHERRILSALQL